MDVNENSSKTAEQSKKEEQTAKVQTDYNKNNYSYNSKPKDNGKSGNNLILVGALCLIVGIVIGFFTLSYLVPAGEEGNIPLTNNSNQFVPNRALIEAQISKLNGFYTEQFSNSPGFRLLSFNYLSEDEIIEANITDLSNQTFLIYFNKNYKFSQAKPISVEDLIAQQRKIKEDTEKALLGFRTQVDSIRASADDDAVKGDINAPVEIIEFSDFQCPYCKKFYDEGYKGLKDYIDQGKVKIVFRDFPLNAIHPNAQKAAEAAECAGEQNKYYEMHDKLFENQNDLAVPSLKRYAKEIGLNENLFNTCLDSSAMASEVQKDLEQGANEYMVMGTPTFFINGKRYYADVGIDQSGQPTIYSKDYSAAALKAEIDKILASKTN